LRELRELKREEEPDVDVSEAHPPTVLYGMVSLHLGWNSADSRTPDVVSRSPLLYGFAGELRWAGWSCQANDVGQTIGRWRSAVIAICRNFILVFVYRVHFPPSDNLREAVRFLVFSMSERIFYYRIPFSSPWSQPRSSQLASFRLVHWSMDPP
jgi:hypothetical protein